ncbi:hypothetical protein EDD18DRAFT_644431 [Armillaria luteobubalina]|uniref:Uncharacterized protein n=1 Tax=Armillaria luteobubalina TaxID=153913 RepID=A0AA39PPG7_9AGAR|nr:hypothetical protein EDD18DRAFT_644431 [Armillaria luteobubalina]
MTGKTGKVNSEKKRIREEENILPAAKRTSAARGTSITPKVPPHNQKEMDLEKARLISEVNNLENKVVFLEPEETFSGFTGQPPRCPVCKEPVKGLPVAGTLTFEKVNFAGFKAFRRVHGESTHDADERNEKTVCIHCFVDIRLTCSMDQLKDRVVRRSIYYHWSCLKGSHKRHYADTPPIRHSSVDSKVWEKVLSDIKASVSRGKRQA